MVERIKYLINNDYLNLENEDFVKFESIRDDVLILLNLSLKMGMRENLYKNDLDKNVLLKITNKLSEIKEIEKILYKKVFELL